jgi:hypothetical protein
MPALLVLMLLSAVAQPLVAQGPDSRGPNHAASLSLLTAVYQAIREDPVVRSAHPGQTLFVLLDLGPDGQVVRVDTLSDRRSLNLIGQARGRFALSGFIRGGRVAEAKVYFYLARGPGLPGPRPLTPAI